MSTPLSTASMAYSWIVRVVLAVRTLAASRDEVKREKGGGRAPSEGNVSPGTRGRSEPQARLSIVEG